MTRTAAAARVASTRNFSHARQSARGNLAFDGAFRNEEARANQRFVAGPLVTRRIAVFANRSQKRVARQLRTMFAPRLQPGEFTSHCAHILADEGRVASRNIHNALRQQRRRGHQHTTTRRLKLCLRHDVLFVNLQREPHVRTTDNRRRPTYKTRLIRIAHISRIVKMIGYDFRQD